MGATISFMDTTEVMGKLGITRPSIPDCYYDMTEEQEKAYDAFLAEQDKYESHFTYSSVLNILRQLGFQVCGEDYCGSVPVKKFIARAEAFLADENDSFKLFNTEWSVYEPHSLYYRVRQLVRQYHNSVKACYAIGKRKPVKMYWG